jgi:hypothetical protein
MGTYIPIELRRCVYERAGGRCEYCLISDTVVLVPHEIDHIISQKHGGPTESENLALSCTLCNKHKGSDLASLDPVTGNIVPPYHPRQDRWPDHFQLNDAQIIPLTPKGRVTVRLLQLNSPERMEERGLLIAAGLFQLPG